MVRLYWWKTQNVRIYTDLAQNLLITDLGILTKAQQMCWCASPPWFSCKVAKNRELLLKDTYGIHTWIFSLAPVFFLSCFKKNTYKNQYFICKADHVIRCISNFWQSWHTFIARVVSDKKSYRERDVTCRSKIFAYTRWSQQLSQSKDTNLMQQEFWWAVCGNHIKLFGNKTSRFEYQSTFRVMWMWADKKPCMKASNVWTMEWTSSRSRFGSNIFF